jgi:hypothetical protein
MQKWQYITIESVGDVVARANSVQIAKPKGFLRVEAPKLHEYLNQMGQDGWEVCGMGSSPTSGIEAAHLIILKRSLEHTTSQSQTNTMSSKSCPHCNSENQFQARFCVSCGKPL